MKAAFSIQQTQKLALTPQLRQAIQTLQLSTLELLQEISQKVEQNPLLELDEYSSESTDEQVEETELSWDIPSSGEVEAWEFKEAPKTLQAHLLEQANCLNLTAEDRILLEWLIGSLDENGFLTEDISKIAADFPYETEAEFLSWLSALKLLQSFDPIGVGANSVTESLCLQIREKERLSEFEPHICKAAARAVNEFLNELGKKNYRLLQKSLACTQAELQQVLRLIDSLNPRPASAFSTEVTHYAIPEISVAKVGERWEAKLIESAVPQVRINEVYAQAVSELSHSDAWAEKLKEARFLIKNIEQRKSTLLKVAQYIVSRQQEFFSHGPSAMHPLLAKDVAAEIGIHESTVSRAVKGKFLICSLGNFELREFFSSSLGESSNEQSSTSVKALIKELISEENASKPLSDDRLSKLLLERNIPVARRTVAKYRESLGIAPASLRKKL